MTFVICVNGALYSQDWLGFHELKVAYLELEYLFLKTFDITYEKNVNCIEKSFFYRSNESRWII